MTGDTTDRVTIRRADLDALTADVNHFNKSSSGLLIDPARALIDNAEDA